MPTYTRPGVEAAVRLSKRIHNELQLWTSIEGKYKDMLGVKKGNELLELDEECERLGMKWRSMINSNNGGGESSKDNSESSSDCIPFITCEELYQVMKWKFTKGKSRPLWKHIYSNNEEDVIIHSKNAFSKVSTNSGNDSSINDDSIASAIQDLSNLKGIGPAGSSAILSLFKPELFVFMDDEVIECLYEGKRDYNLKVYTNINDKCRTIATQLGNGWTPRRVGRALWSAAIISGYSNDIDLTLVNPRGDSNVPTNNVACTEEKMESIDSRTQRKKKRQKTL